MKAEPMKKLFAYAACLFLFAGTGSKAAVPAATPVPAGAEARELYLKNSPAPRFSTNPDGTMSPVAPSQTDILKGSVIELSNLIAARERELDALRVARDLLAQELGNLP